MTLHLSYWLPYFFANWSLLNGWCTGHKARLKQYHQQKWGGIDPGLVTGYHSTPTPNECPQVLSRDTSVLPHVMNINSIMCIRLSNTHILNHLMTYTSGIHVPWDLRTTEPYNGHIGAIILSVVEQIHTQKRLDLTWHENHVHTSPLLVFELKVRLRLPLVPRSNTLA